MSKEFALQIIGEIFGYLERTPRVTEMTTPQSKNLNLGQVPGASVPEKIFTEATAFQDYYEVVLDEETSVMITNVYATWPHTFLTFPSKIITDQHDEISAAQSPFTSEDSHWQINHIPKTNPDSYYPNDSFDPEKIQLPLHFLPYVFLVKKQAGTIKIDNFNPVDLYEIPLEELRQTLPIDSPQQRQELVATITNIINHFHSINRQIGASLYNQHIVPIFANTIANSLPLKQQGVHYTYDELVDHFKTTIETMNMYTNIGHDPIREYDTNRGPASIATLHSFFRMIIFKKFIQLIGSKDNTLLTHEHSTFQTLVNEVSDALRDRGFLLLESSVLNVEDIDVFAAKDIRRLAKNLDIFGIMERELLVEPMTKMIDQAIAQKFPKASVTAYYHQTERDELVAGHSAAVRIFVPNPSIQPGEINAIIQPVLEKVYKIRGNLFDLYRQYHTKELTPTDLMDQISALLDVIPDEPESIAATCLNVYHYLTSIKPTQKMLEEWSLANTDVRVQIPQELINTYTSRNLTKKEMTNLAILTFTKLQLQEQLQEEIDSVGSKKANRANIQQQLTDKVIKNQFCTKTPMQSEKNYLNWLHKNHPQVCEHAAKHIARTNYVTTDKSIKAYTSCSLSKKAVMYFLEMERLGIRPLTDNPSNACLYPGYLMAYKITDEGIDYMLNIVSGERGSIEAIRGLQVIREIDNSMVNPQA